MTLFRLCRVLNVIKARLDAQPGGGGEYAGDDLAPVPSLLTGLPCTDRLYQVPRKLTAEEIGAWLLRAFLQTGQVLGVRLVRRATAQVTYQVYAGAASASVLAAFYARAAGRPVYGVKQPRAWTRLRCPAIPSTQPSREPLMMQCRG